VLQSVPADRADEPQELIGTRLDLAHVYLATGRLSEAERQLRLAVERARAVTPGEQILSRALASLGRCLLARGKYAEAEQVLTEAVGLHEAARTRAGPGWVGLRREQSPHAPLAAAHLLSGNTEAAWPAAEQALGRILSDVLLASDERWLSSTDAIQGDSLREQVTRIQTQSPFWRRPPTAGQPQRSCGPSMRLGGTVGGGMGLEQVPAGDRRQVPGDRGNRVHA